jgi:hypothetical protein
VDLAKRAEAPWKSPWGLSALPPNTVELTPTLGARAPPEAGPSRTKSSYFLIYVILRRGLLQVLRGGFLLYRGTLTTRKRPPPQEPPRILGIGLGRVLWGYVFSSVRYPCRLLGKVELYPSIRRRGWPDSFPLFISLSPSLSLSFSLPLSLAGSLCVQHSHAAWVANRQSYMGTSLIRNSAPLGP